MGKPELAINQERAEFHAWQNLFEFVEGCDVRDQEGYTNPMQYVDRETFDAHKDCPCRARSKVVHAERLAEGSIVGCGCAHEHA